MFRALVDEIERQQKISDHLPETGER
jgi:hypothetical protein